MKAILFATLFSVMTLLPAVSKADSNDIRNYNRQYDPDRPHLVWVHRHFIWVNGHRVLWVPGHPSVR